MSKIPTVHSEVVVTDVADWITDNVSVVTIKADIQHDVDTEFYGVAKRHPGDKPNADVARLLATARAYRSLAEGLERRANGYVAHHDDVMAHRKSIKENWSAHSRRRRYWLKKTASVRS